MTEQQLCTAVLTHPCTSLTCATTVSYFLKHVKKFKTKSIRDRVLRSQKTFPDDLCGEMVEWETARKRRWGGNGVRYNTYPTMSVVERF